MRDLAVCWLRAGVALALAEGFLVLVLAGAAVAQTFTLQAPSTVARGGEVNVRLEGSSAFDLTGFTARVGYDIDRLNAVAQRFAGGVWSQADFLVVDDSVPGEVFFVAVQDTSQSGAVVGGGDGRLFAEITFIAQICTGPTTVTFIEGPEDNMMVDSAVTGHDLSGNSLVSTVVEIVEGASFVRGNANNSTIDASTEDATTASVTIADGIFVLTSLFVSGGADPACADAADANNDGRYDIVDSVTILQVLFNNSFVLIPEPFENIGADDSDSLGCLTPPPVIGCP